MKQLLKWTLITVCALPIAAAIGLWRYDQKEKSWYQDTAGIAQKNHTRTTAVVCILATVHHATPDYNADSIVGILGHFQPDLILTEEDTALFVNYHQCYEQTLKKPLFARLGRSFGFGSSEEIEGIAVRKYKISHPAVNIRPFDFEGRNAFYTTHNTFLKEEEVGNKLAQLAAGHSLRPEHAKIWNAYHRINDTLNQLNNLNPYAINQQGYYNLTERRQEYQYHKIAEIVYSNDSLKGYSDFYRTNAGFWATRNKTMSLHIAHFIKQYPNKRVMVLTGSMHKYYLLNELSPLEGFLKFRLQEYYDR